MPDSSSPAPELFHASHFFDLSRTQHQALFANTRFVWEAISRIDGYIAQCFADGLPNNAHSLNLNPSVIIGDKPIYIGPGTSIEPGAYIQGPAIIGANCKIGQGAYIRANVVVGDGSVVGHVTEIKNSVMLEESHAPHFAYVGDCLIGQRVNLGAGTKLSNLAIHSQKDASGQRPVLRFSYDGRTYDTGLAKLGAILGDDVQLGCNCVTNPACLVGPRTLVYALVSLGKGYYPADSIIKLRQHLEIVQRYL